MNHPIVERMNLSRDQWPAVLARRADVLVTAGAGTGKTRSLVARYLSLVAEGISPREIAAITFTKKAAREMRNRVREEMRLYLEGLDPADGEYRRWAGYFNELDAARIGTIHSLCTEVLRGHPAEARLDPRFEVLDEGVANILRSEARDAALAWAADYPEVVALFRLLGEYGLGQALDALLRDRLNAAAAFDVLPDDILSFWQGMLERRQREALESLLSDPDWREHLALLAVNHADNDADRIEEQRRLVLAAAYEAGRAATVFDKRLALSALGKIKLNGGSMSAWPGGKEQLGEVKNALKALRDHWKAAAGILELELNDADASQAGHLPLLRALFDRAVAEYRARKDERYALDFDDLEHQALELLTNFPDVRAYWQQVIKAVLVDEFQDTNGRQRDLVLALCERPGKRFVVGDAKQSIYRFRGADVTVFRGEESALEKSGGALYALNTSYRAHRDLVRGLNDLLAPVLGPDGESTPDWIAPFSPLVHHREAPLDGLNDPFIELHLTVGSKSGGALDRAALAVAGRIAQLVDGCDGLSFGDVAVLCRASTSFGAYEDAFDRAGIPFLTVAGRGFYHRPEIRDILNGLRALADPTDDLALVGLLRSPSCALSDPAIYQLVAGRPAGTSLWTALRQGAALPEPDGGRAARAVELIAGLHQRAGRATVADLLKDFLDETGYLAALIQSDQQRAARNVEKLLADALTSNMVGISDFLAYVTGLRDSGTREGEARTTREGAVQIMSVHAAKGLEFPVVVLGDINYDNPQRSDLLTDPELGVLLPQKDEDRQSGAMYTLGRQRYLAQEAAELDRLLYVAATRAQEMLLLNGCFKLSQSGSPGYLRGWLKRLAGPTGFGDIAFGDYDETGARALPFSLMAQKTALAGRLYEPAYRPGETRAPRVHPAEAAPKPVLPPPLLAPFFVAASEEESGRALREDRSQWVWRVVPDARRPMAPAWVVGLLVHEALAAWRFPEAAFHDWAVARARGYGLTDREQLTDAARRAAIFLTRFQEHELFRTLDRADRRLHEVPYSLEQNGQVEFGTIDILYLRDGRWTIVDFKTDRVRDRAGLQQLLVARGYEEQVRRYMAAVQELLEKSSRGILCLLDVEGEVVMQVVSI
jgi:ATP-dependent helicase/nuclease subunit A